jgi:hypothetical protein
MAELNASTFMSSVPLSARWRYVEGPFSNVVFSQGRNVINAIRATMNLTATGTWDDALQAALIEAVRRLNAPWVPVLTALQRDAADRVVRDLSLQVALYFAFYRRFGRRFDAIRLEPGTVMPTWDAPAPFSRGPLLVAYDPGVDRDPKILDSAALAEAVQHSVSGVRIESGRPAPSSATRIVTQESAVPTVVVVGLVVVILVGAVALARRSGSDG